MQSLDIKTWRCSCGKIVQALESGMPVSKYYSQDHRRVFCSPECSLTAYEKPSRLNNSEGMK